MPAQLIDGKALAARVRDEVARGCAELATRGVVPGLAVILVGDDPASQIYVRSKGRAAEKVGVHAFDHRLPATTQQGELLALIATLNADPAVHGILLQLPLPKHLDPAAAQDAISAAKDVDGLHPHNLGLLAQGRPRFVPCTPNGCMRMLAELESDPAGKRAVVIGRSNLVGRPMLMLLANANATVIGCHSRTRDLAAEVRGADIIVAAAGVPELVKGDWVQPGAIVLDVGMNRRADGSLCGDVDFAAVSQHAGAITPVPGGVGPMTIAGLLENTLASARERSAVSR